MGAFLEEARFVSRKYRVRIGQVLQRIVAHLVPYSIGIPAGTVQQMLNTVWHGMPGRFGQLPAILALDGPQQTMEIIPARSCISLRPKCMPIRSSSASNICCHVRLAS